MAEMYRFCLCIILNVPLPLGPMAILLTVLVTDMLPAGSLMYNKNNENSINLNKFTLLFICHLAKRMSKLKLVDKMEESRVPGNQSTQN